MKVMTVVGTRPEVIRLSETIKQLNNDFNHVLVHTGQNYSFDLNEVFFQDLNLPAPNYYLDSAGETPTITIATILSKIEPILIAERPDAFLILGDTNSCLSALAAKKHKIPIFHMEAGNRCFDQRVPEEINRRIIDHLADVNLTYSQISRDYLINEGLKPDFVIRIGSPMREVLQANESKWKQSIILKNLGISKDEYILASFHREENVDSAESLTEILNSLNELVKITKCPIIVSTHPRTRNRITEIGFSLDQNITLTNPFSFNDYINLQMNALVVLSDSGTITEEASILGFTGVNLRNSQERPEGMEESTVILSGMKTQSIIDSVSLALKHKYANMKFNMVIDYTDTNISLKVSRIIQSYVHYVNEFVWHKNQ
jgi:UDP-N-acetylglucosamine 2-epimerase (non-hydrolysing)